MTTFVIPFRGIAETFQINLAGVPYILTVYWNDADGTGWVLDITDATSNVNLVAGIPLVTGDDILDGLEYLGINGSLIVYTDGDATAVPTYANLGLESNLYFITSVAGNG